jgi:octaheme c-type cytochrome (tetrathionate reductase family)
MENIDCLVCHDTTGSYEKVPTGAGMPSAEVDLVHVAKNVGPTSRKTCGDCHFFGGGGDQVKHADMGSELDHPSRNCDIHMGGYGFTCTECHKPTNHKIPGRSSSVAAAEGTIQCADCHTQEPHYGDDLLDYHLNEHCDHIACNTCHSPLYARLQPTKVWWDWSESGDKDREVPKGLNGTPLYNWKKGVFEWAKKAKPSYAWFNGYMHRTLAGDRVDLEGKTVDPDAAKEVKQEGEYIHLTHPVGSKKDPQSKITPFKIMRGVQPADPNTGLILIPHLYPYDDTDTTAYWKNLDWPKAFAEGMQAMDLPYSGEHVWVRTDMYWRFEHEVLPEEAALGCQQCHETLQGEKTCDRCHQPARTRSFTQLMKRKEQVKAMEGVDCDLGDLHNATNYLGFEALGYEGDPIIYGGRFKRLPLQSE